MKKINPAWNASLHDMKSKSSKHVGIHTDQKSQTLIRSPYSLVAISCGVGIQYKISLDFWVTTEQ